MTKNPDQSLWESILPECCLEMPPELARVDGLFDDVAFFEPYRAHFDPDHGRRSTPIETYLRMMFLKSRYKLSYEVLSREVADSISWRRFCHIPLGAPVPHPTTLMKITTRCGGATVEKLNQALLEKAAAAKVLKLHKVRADTTVVEANVAYPTDSGLLAKAVARMARLVERIHAAGGATRTKVRDRRRAAGRRVRNIAANLKLRNDDAKEKVRQINAELADLAETAAGEAVAVARNARRKLARCGDDASKKLAALVAELEATMALTATVVAQTRTRLGGDKPARRRHQGRIAARPRRPPDRQGAPGQARGVRLQGPGPRQRRRRGPRPPGGDGQPARRADARPCRRPRQGAGRQGAEGGDGRRHLRGGGGGGPAQDHGRQDRRHPPQGQARRRPPGVPGPALVPQAGEVAHGL